MGLIKTRSQAESYIKLGQVKVNGLTITKPGYQVDDKKDNIKLSAEQQYVSRAALKLESVVSKFDVNFKNAKVLDVGSSTGGFTDFAIRHGAEKVVAIELGSNQLDPNLKSNPQIDLHEKTDILNVQPYGSTNPGLVLNFVPDVIVIDLSFISLRQVLPHIRELADDHTLVLAMVKPQFEATALGLKHKGVIKNEKIRRQILNEFETWAKELFVIINKADSAVSGSKGNLERFYLLKTTA